MRITIIGLGAILLVFWRYPTGAVVVWIVLGVLVALLVLELFVRPARNRQATHADTSAPVG